MGFELIFFVHHTKFAGKLHRFHFCSVVLGLETENHCK